jgi:hemerythrin
MRKTSEVIWQDAQHQVLFDILDRIKEPDADGEVLQLLKNYTETHFSLEEKYMVELEYPGLRAHQQAHKKFCSEIDKLLVNSADHDAQFKEIISTFLTEWLTRHVFGIDKELEAFILKSPIK